MPRTRPAGFVEKLSLAPAFAPARARRLAAAAGLACLMAGCTSPPTSPFEGKLQSDLRRSMIDAARRELREADQHPQSVTTTRPDGESTLGMNAEQIAELKKMAGIQSYVGMPLPLPDDLTGAPSQTVHVSLERLVKSAVERNIAVQFARLGPAVSSAQVLAAEGSFDWTFFSNLSFQNTNEPNIGSAATQSQTFQSSLGLRRTLVSGGRLTVQHELSYFESKPPGPTTTNQTAFPSAVTLQWDQPLLRNFGTEVTQAEIRVARNAERNAVETLRRDLMRVASDTESRYWELVQAYQDVLILQRLLDRGIRVRDQLIQRAPLDANAAQIADAMSRVTTRQDDLISAQTQLALISDQLKTLVNDPEFPAGSTILLIPSDFPIDQPVRYSLSESIRSALRYRPEIQSAILAIDDASIRQTVSRNARLPDLSLRLQAKYSGLNDQVHESYNDIWAGNFASYVAGLTFEMPIGNRRAEGDYRRRVLERMQSVLAYRNTVQTTVAEVLSALRQVALFYKRIESSRTNVLATAEALRVLQVEKEIGPGYTVERLNLEFQQQERLAAAERGAVDALVRYNSVIAALFQSMGTTLERNNIQLVVPTVDDALEGARGTSGWAGEPVLPVEKDSVK